jgi:tRNA dimethylallyltransferase
MIVLLGPTAVGKTALSISLAKKFNGVIFSADSRQVYRGMDLGTGKVTKREMAGVPHYLLDVVAPTRQYSVARYLRDVRRAMQDLSPTTPVFLVGGSPFYIDAVTKPGSISSVPPNPALRKQLATWTLPRLLKRLTQLDPERATTIDQQNPRRIIRAIEIARGTPTILPTLPPFRILTLGLRLPNEQLFKRIDQRVDARMKRGMLKEVQHLHDSGVSWKRLDAFGLEYRFLARYLRGELTKSEAIQQLTSAIHDFARRQMTWWKRDTSIHWVKNEAQAVKLIRPFLKE